LGLSSKACIHVPHSLFFGYKGWPVAPDVFAQVLLPTPHSFSLGQFGDICLGKPDLADKVPHELGI
jgi:hypothetical protein